MSCNCGGEVYYCEECRSAFARDEVKERRITDDVRHHGHDHADCPLCGKELCDAGHVEVCEAEMQFALKMVENAQNYADSQTDRTNMALITTRLKEAIEITESEADNPPSISFTLAKTNRQRSFTGDDDDNKNTI